MLPLAEPLTVSGLNRGLAQRLTEAGGKARRPILAAPALPLAPFPPQPPRPGSSLSVGYSAGDLAVGAVGTVAYVDGDRVWGFGHPFENSGLRSLLLQDAYVYDVISNPNVGADTGSTYKLAAAGHTLGTISNDASAAVVGRSGAPPATVPVRIFTEDEDTGGRSTLGARVVDETDVGTPTGSSALSFVAPLALAQAASAILRSAPGQLSGTVCVRIALRERKRPLRFCNRYASAVAPSDPEAGENIVAAGSASDALTALTDIDDFKQRPLHVTEFAARVKLRRGLRQAFIRSVSLRTACGAGTACARRCTSRSSAGRASRAHSACASPARCGRASDGSPSSGGTSTTRTPTSSARSSRRSRSATRATAQAPATPGRARSTRSRATSAASRATTA